MATITILTRQNRQVKVSAEIHFHRVAFTNGAEFVETRKRLKMSCPKCGVCGKSLDVDAPLDLIGVVGHKNQLVHQECAPEKEQT